MKPKMLKNIKFEEFCREVLRVFVVKFVHRRFIVLDVFDVEEFKLKKVFASSSISYWRSNPAVCHVV